MNDDFAITLSLDELLALLDLLGFASMNGLPPNPLAGVPKKQQEQRLQASLQSLQRRGLATQTGEIAVLDDALTALVTSCLRPAASLVLVGRLPDGTEDVHLFNVTPDIRVEHSFTHLDSHTFRFFARGATLLTRVREALLPVEAAAQPGAFAGVWPWKLLNEVIAQARGGRGDKAIKALSKARWPQPEAEAFAAAVARWPVYTAVYAWNLHSTPIGGQQTVMIVADRRRCWLLEPQAAAAQDLTVRAVAGSTAVEVILALAQSLATVAETS